MSTHGSTRMKTLNTHDKLIDQIVMLEMEMFQSTISTVHSPCQDRLETFRTMRWMHHSVLSKETLESHLYDLTVAKQHGRNLMIEKYARMENKIPPLKTHPAIATISSIELEWMNELAEKDPATFNGNHDGFLSYISAELETLSDRTLELLLETTLEAKTHNINLIEKRYNNLFKRLEMQTDAT